MERKRIDILIKFLGEKKFFILGLALIIFIVYKHLLYCIFNNLCPYGPSFTLYLFLPGIGIFLLPYKPLLLYPLGIGIFLLSYKISFKLRESKRVILFFLVTILMQLSIYSAFYVPLENILWADSESYYNLAVLGSEKGPIYFINNYHALVKWDRDYKGDVEDDLRKLGIFEWTSGKIGWEEGTGKEVYRFKTALHPPFWMLILSLFIFLFGEGPYSVLFAEWFFTALVPVALYYWVKRFGDTNAAIKTTFLFILVPAFITQRANHITMDAPLALFVIISSYFYLTSLEKGDFKIAILSGVLFSLCFLTKFTALVLYAPFLALAFLRLRSRGIKLYLIFLISSLVLPFLLMLFDYYFFLNIILARLVWGNIISSAIQANYIDISLKYLVLQYLKEISHFSIPVFFLVFLGALRLPFSKMVWDDKVNLVFLLTFLGSGAIVMISLTRYLLPFLPLIMGMVTRELYYLKASNRFMFLSFVICVTQKFLFILFP